MILKSGREFWPNCGIIGINDKGETFAGYDNPLEGVEIPSDHVSRTPAGDFDAALEHARFTPDERHEIADEMIARWRKWGGLDTGDPVVINGLALTDDQAVVLRANSSPAAALPVHERLFTLEQVKLAFWAEFHLSGEQWFNYLSSDEDNHASTEGGWQSFLGELESQPIVALHVTEDKDARIAALEQQVLDLQSEVLSLRNQIEENF